MHLLQQDRLNVPLKNNIVLWHDFAYGDTYEIHFNDANEFEAAYRYRGQVGAEPALVYYSVDSIPTHHRGYIDKLVWQQHAHGPK
jgi:hypothetical protein